MRSKSLRIILYPIVIEACKGGGYFADCSSPQGCHAEGETYSEVIENIEDVIRAHIEIRKKHQEFIPSVIVKDGEKVDVNLPILIRA